jgi:aminopeptidase
MDPRVHDHAATLVDHCTAVGAGDDVLVKAPAAAEDLVVALYELLGERGARPKTTLLSPRAGRAYARAMDAADFCTKAHALAEMEATDVVIMVQGATNTAETTDVAPEKGRASSRANQPVLQTRLESTDWVITQHPTPADAQAAGLSTDAWTDFVYDAVNRDWVAQRERQQRVVERLDAASEARLVAGDDTDLTLSLDGMAACSDHAQENLPGGEVFTSPVVDSVEGEVTFDLPVVRRGRELEDVHLVFEDGVVVDHDAARNADLLASVLETDAGARRVGELGIGMNRGIDRVSRTLLFDEKMGGTVHLALGNAIEAAVPEAREFNESAVHVDLLVDVRTDARLEVDGEVLLRDGSFWFEA